ncbi:CerR family C-terminal domain-containing protein [Massilia antarctica]|uniref:CerR family C-terminal domain-containing protein n=1 Tax=Massilia antarctica TaxID=2765360 RepID=A0AA48WFS0_9BURK|nr:CerR family C-terminal domain-containing protein [Massilia antarctica]QPI50440.1 CerR family C-terminal domain-containing protein [Massilia antarctica]
MEKTPTLPADDARRTRSDGAQSRERLLLAAIRLFAEQGFAKTSTREIALAAGTNIASISYYFGDKAGLYRAAFTEPSPCDPNLAVFTATDATLRETLEGFYAVMMADLKRGDLARMSMRLWFREMLEPTGVWDEEIDNGIKPAHAALMMVLGRHLGLAAPDDDLQRLAFSLVGLAVQLMVTRDVIDRINPHLLENDAAIDAWMARLVDYGEAMVKAELARRKAGAAQPITKPRKKKA